MATKGYVQIDAATDKIALTQVPTTNTGIDAIFKSLQAGYDGQSGSLILYSEQGATDYRAALNPNAAMTAHSSFYLPAAVPAATYMLAMTNGGVMVYDTSVYINNVDPQTIGGVKTFSVFPVTPSALPSANYEVANKAYVDSLTSNSIW